MKYDAVIDGPYRYTLTRTWDETLPKLMYLGHNPSTADHTKEDATSRRFLGFARLWGYGSYTTVNVAALRARDKKELPKHADPFGPRNQEFISESAEKADKIVVCCGTPSWEHGRAKAVRLFAWLSSAFNLYGVRDQGEEEPKLTKDGFPVHLLYQPSSMKPVLFRAAV